MLIPVRRDEMSLNFMTNVRVHARSAILKSTRRCAQLCRFHPNLSGKANVVDTYPNLSYSPTEINLE
jgi:hypothetical protein